jgi:hypothetical protein
MGTREGGESMSREDEIMAEADKIVKAWHRSLDGLPESLCVAVAGKMVQAAATIVRSIDGPGTAIAMFAAIADDIRDEEKASS